MNRVLITLCLIAALPTSGYGQNDTLTIATFNCEFLNRSKVHIKFGLEFNISKEDQATQDQWNQTGFRDQRFNEAAQAVAAVIASVDADVITLTEVGNVADVTELVGEISNAGVDYPNVAIGDSSDSFTRQNVAILSKFPISDILTPIPGREYYLTEFDDPEAEKDTGISKGMRATVTAHNRDFLIYAVHFTSEGGEYNKDAQRIAQASLVRRHYLPEIKAGNLVIVTGDLNDRRGDPAIRRVRGLDDIHEDLIQTGTIKYFDEAEWGTRWTYEFKGVRNQIDHILPSFAVKAETKTQNGIEAETFEHGNALASDHKPFILTLNLNN